MSQDIVGMHRDIVGAAQYVAQALPAIQNAVSAVQNGYGLKEREPSSALQRVLQSQLVTWSGTTATTTLTPQTTFRPDYIVFPGWLEDVGNITDLRVGTIPILIGNAAGGVPCRAFSAMNVRNFRWPTISPAISVNFTFNTLSTSPASFYFCMVGAAVE